MRLEMMVLMGSENLPLTAIRHQIAAAIDIVVHLGRLRDKTRRVLEIIEVKGMNAGQIETVELYRFEEQGEKDGRVIGELRKAEDLKNVTKLKEAGLFSVYTEKRKSR